MTVQENTESCIVRLVEQGGQRRTGTGFFVAPGYILTCAHVVEPELGEPLVEFSVEHSTGSWQAMPEQCRPDGTADLALLRIPSTEHPCVLFSATAEPTDIVWTQGYVVKQGEIRLEPTTGEIEGERRAHLETGGPEYTLIKFKGGQVIPGMSGSPLLNYRTGAVCGVVARTLNEQNDAGGLAVPLRSILASYPFIAEKQSEYHRAHSEWRLFGLVLPTPALKEKEKIAIVGSFPIGPAVYIGVPLELISAFYGLTVTDGLSIIAAANSIRIKVDPGILPRLIILLNYSDHEGIVTFWMSVFTNAAARGPRMLAALLYEAPPGTFEGLEQTLHEFLATLRTWPIP